ncbi:predicted protein [Chaetoceros tenuissimus]|uniref:Uncharacterized protein n=1 Tax=Chaetoceros tenuissimus TaxID=426638 RepID=A0AAD3D7E0_9STRA|nr:predicted protein [Chaetoceros tenuissimus]
MNRMRLRSESKPEKKQKLSEAKMADSEGRDTTASAPKNRRNTANTKETSTEKSAAARETNKKGVSTSAQNISKPSLPSLPSITPKETRKKSPLLYLPISPIHPHAEPAPSCDDEVDEKEVDEKYKGFRAFLLPKRFEPPENKSEVVVLDVSDEVIMEFGSLFAIGLYNTPEDFVAPAEVAYRIYKNRPSSSKSRAPQSMFRIVLNTCLIMAIHYDDKMKKTKKDCVTDPLFQDFKSLMKHENNENSSLLHPAGHKKLEEHLYTFLRFHFQFLHSEDLTAIVYASDFKRSFNTWKGNLKNEQYLQDYKRMLQLMFNLKIHDKPEGWKNLRNLRK